MDVQRAVCFSCSNVDRSRGDSRLVGRRNQMHLELGAGSYNKLSDSVGNVPIELRHVQQATSRVVLSRLWFIEANVLMSMYAVVVIVADAEGAVVLGRWLS